MVQFSAEAYTFYHVPVKSAIVPSSRILVIFPAGRFGLGTTSLAVSNLKFMLFQSLVF